MPPKTCQVCFTKFLRESFSLPGFTPCCCPLLLSTYPSKTVILQAILLQPKMQTLWFWFKMSSAPNSHLFSSQGWANSMPPHHLIFTNPREKQAALKFPPKRTFPIFPSLTRQKSLASPSLASLHPVLVTLCLLSLCLWEAFSCLCHLHRLGSLRRLRPRIIRDAQRLRPPALKCFHPALEILCCPPSQS